MLVEHYKIYIHMKIKKVAFEMWKESRSLTQVKNDFFFFFKLHRINIFLHCVILCSLIDCLYKWCIHM